LRAIRWALGLTRTVPSLALGGFTFSDLFVAAAQLLRSNLTISSLKIVNYANHNGFLLFLKSLPVSGLSSLTFVSVTFQRTIITHLVEFLASVPNLKHLGFVSCGFDSFVFGAIFESAEHLSSLDSLEISRDETEIALSFVPSIVNLISLACLKTAIFSQMSIDISAFLRALETSRVIIENLDLSGNRCSKNFTRGVSLPATLKSLSLANVKWEGNTFLLFLSTQPFPTAITLKLSSAHFTSIAPDPFAELAGIALPIQVISVLAWDENRLTPHFLAHLERFSHLERLSLQRCPIDPDFEAEMPQLTVRCIESLRLKKLSLAGTFRFVGPRFMPIFKLAFLNHQTLQQLDISDNGIRTSGLKDLKDIVLHGTQINQVWCDGSCPDHWSDLLQFFNDLAQTERLIFIAKPRSDISSLIGKESVARDQADQNMKAAWRRLSQTTQDNARRLDGTSDVEYAVDDGTASQQMLDPVGTPLTPIDASWEISIELGYGGDITEWDGLRHKFSIERLIGVEPIVEEEETGSLTDVAEV
jgi:hypothetical protein